MAMMDRMGSSAADRVYHGLLSAIRSGELHFGTELIETEIAARFGVSRTPVREAVRRLTQAGLLRRTNSGISVVKLTAEELNDIYPLIGVMEGLAAWLAAPKIRSSPQWQQLVKTLASMRVPSSTEDVDRFFQLNQVFHGIILEVAENKILASEISRFRTMTRIYRMLALGLPGRMDASVREHEAIVAAFESGDADLAETLMKRHVDSSHKMLQALSAGAELFQKKE